MKLDFTKLQSNLTKAATIEPRKIFSTLTRAARFKRPTDEQGEVLDSWFARRTRPDNTIKMNTGSGKTLVGLLALQSCLNENCGPAVYVAPDNYLVAQACAEANELGIAITNSEDDPAFLAGKAILVINVWKLFNAKSRFGVGSTGVKINIGSIVIDDAHACLGIVADQFKMRVGRGTELYGALLKLFWDDLVKQSHPGALDVEAADPHALMSVPYWAWHDHRDEVMRLLHAHRNDEEIKWSWPLLNEVIGLCQCVFGPAHLEIAPRCLPIDMIPAFTRAKRKIYMTATLADDGILISHFLADLDAVRDPIKPKGAGDMGDRMILAPQEINSAITVDEIRALAAKISKKRNVVVIVPSSRKVLEWKGVATQILDKDSIEKGVESLKAGHVGLTVLLNKYDGVDLPGKACELLIVDGLPEVHGLIERADLAKLDGTESQNIRHVQKLEQGMGRGVRSSDDHCLVLLLGAKLTHRVNDPAIRSKFTAATQAQLALGREVASQVAGKPLSEFLQVFDLCLDQDVDWVQASRSAVALAPDVDTSFVDPAIPLIRQAFDLARANKFDAAVNAMRAAVNNCKDKFVRGYYQEQLAEYVHRLSPTDSQEVLSSAVTLNRRVTKPLAGIRYRKLDSSQLEQAKEVVQFVNSQFKHPNELVIWTNAVIEDLRWDPDATDKFEDAVENLGRLLGFGSQRPERETNQGPDNLWSLGDKKYLIIEDKSGSLSDKISKKDSSQLLNSYQWFLDKYGKEPVGIPVIVHPSNVFDKQAAPRADTRIIDDARLKVLKAKLQDFVVALTKDDAFSDPDKVIDLLKHFGFTANQFVESVTVKFKIAF